MSEQLASPISPSHELFYDPFAEAGEQYFDPVEAHQAMWERYAAGDVEHDYTADKFVADTEALMLDAQFLDRFDEAQAIAARMHIMCGEDHGLRQSVNGNESLNALLDNHIHPETHDHKHEDDEPDDDKSNNKKKKRKQLRRGWLGAVRK